MHALGSRDPDHRLMRRVSTYRIIALLLFLIVMTTRSYAFVYLGIKGGANFANVNAEVPGQTASVDYRVKLGAIGGAFAEVPLFASGTMSVRGELLLVEKGTKYTILDKNYKVSEDELVLAPFLLWYPQLPYLHPFLEIGPEFGINVHDHVLRSGRAPYDSEGNWSSTSINLNFGAGTRVAVGALDAHLEVRYNLGLTNMGSWDPNAAGNVSTKTNGIQILAGFDLCRF